MRVRHERSDKASAEGWPQIRLALSRGIAVSGLLFGHFTQGVALSESCFALGYYRSPLQGFQFAASPTSGMDDNDFG